MTFNLFDRAILREDFPDVRLKRGDVGIVVEHIVREGEEDGYILEFFDAQGNYYAPARRIRPFLLAYLQSRRGYRTVSERQMPFVHPLVL